MELSKNLFINFLVTILKNNQVTIIMTSKSQSFIDAYRQQLLCIHPTDTLWGLTCDLERAHHQLLSYKGSTDKRKGFVRLVATIEDALRLWKPLPGDWINILDNLWPAPLTVVWQGRTKHAENDGTLALRVPALSPPHLWFKDCLTKLGPLISTSVNVSGQPPLSHQAIRKTLADDPRFYLPTLIDDNGEHNQASTVIAITSDGKFKVLRAGALELATLEREVSGVNPI